MLERVLIFRLEGEESARNAASLAKTVRGSGREPHVFAYWPDDSVDLATGETTLLPGGISTAPRFSDFELRRRYGLSLDLADLQTHNFAASQTPLEHFLPETAWSQHLRGIAAVVIDLVQNLAPSHVFVAHGAEVVSRIIAESTAHCGIPNLYWESGFFPDTIYLDPYSPHFFHGDPGLHRSNGQEIGLPSPAQLKALTFIETWKRKQTSKYEQNENDEQLSDLMCWAKQDERPIVFFPGQLEHDANVLPHLGDFSSFAEMARSIFRAIPDEFRIVYKPHPKAEAEEPTDLDRELGDRFFIAHDVSIHSIFRLSAAVLVCTSNVGLEAIVFGLPVLTIGKPIYANQGLTTDLASLEELRHSLSNGCPPPPRNEDVCTFLARLFWTSLLEENDSDGLARTLAQARPAMTEKRISWYPRRVREMVELARDLHGALKREHFVAKALDALPVSTVSSLLRHYSRPSIVAHPFGGDFVSDLQSACRPQPSIKCTSYVSGAEAVFKMAEVPLDCSQDPVSLIINTCEEAGSGEAIAFSFSLEKRMPGAVQFLTVETLLDICRHHVQGRTLSVIYLDRAQAKHGVVIATPETLVREKSLPLYSLALSYQVISMSPRFFMSRGELIKSDAEITLALAKRHETVLYGPYCNLPSGHWRVSVNLREGKKASLRTALFHRSIGPVRGHLEIVANEAVIERRPFEIGDLKTLCHEFCAKDEQAQYEFRIVAISRIEGCELIFGGIDLEWLGLKRELVPPQ